MILDDLSKSDLFQMARGISNSIEQAGLDIKVGLENAAETLASTQKQIAFEERKANHENTLKMVNAIVDGSCYVEQGLLRIASELKHANILTERHDLEAKIQKIQDWLFDKGFLKEYYQTVNLADRIVPFVNESYVYFCEHVCKFMLTDAEFAHLKARCLSEEELARELNEPKKYLLKLSSTKMCHPLVALAYLISKNGLIYSREDGFRISASTYSWYPWWGEYKIDVNDQGFIYDFGQYQIVFKEAHADMTFENALRHLIQMATNYEKDWLGSMEYLKISTAWAGFFSELNMNIAMHNLRVLANSLEGFKRQKQLDLLN